jgi:hypothetical protein
VAALTVDSLPRLPVQPAEYGPYIADAFRVNADV